MATSVPQLIGPSCGAMLRVLALLLLATCLTACPRESPPQSSSSTRRYAEIPKIDVHTHVPADRARTVIEIFRQQGVVLALNASGGEPGPELDANVAVARATNGRLRPYCNLDFSKVEEPTFAQYARDTLAACKARGAVGLKIFKALGLGITLRDGSLLAVDDARLDVVFEAAGANGLPVLIHTGDPQAFFRPADAENERIDELRAHPDWSFYGPRPNGQPWPSWDEVFSQFERRVARHPGVTFVGAHFGNAPEDPDRVARMLDRNPRFVVETGARVPELGHRSAERMRRFFARYQDRILFGTDFQTWGGDYVLGSSGSAPDPAARIPFFYESHWRYFETRDRGFAHPTPIQGHWTIDGLGLNRAVLEKLYWRNAARVFGLQLPTRRD